MALAYSWQLCKNGTTNVDYLLEKTIILDATFEFELNLNNLIYRYLEKSP